MQKYSASQEPDVLLVVAFSAKAFMAEVVAADWRVETLVPAPRGAANLFERARECPKTRILIIYADALSACASALEQDLGRSEWQQDWVDEAGSLFEFRRHYADRCYMGELRQWVGGGTEHSPAGLEDLTTTISLAVTSPSRVATNIAKDVIAGNSALREWGERLAASSCLPKESVKEPDSTVSDAEVMWREFAAVKQQAGSALGSLAAVQQQLETERNEHEKQLEREQAEIARSREEGDQTRLELGIANLRVAQLQTELESSLEDAQKAHEKADAADAKLASLMADRDRISDQPDNLKKEPQDQLAAVENELAQALTGGSLDEEHRAGLEDIQQRYDQQALELEIANIQIAQLQEELELSLREWDALASGNSRSSSGVGTEIQPQQVRRLLSWSGHNNLQGKPSRLMASPARRERERSLAEDTKLLVESDYFDADWYGSQDEGHLGKMNPVEHYLRHGASQGRDPSPLFDTVGYLLANPDVVATGMNPLVHYLRHGEQEKRSPRPNDN